MMRRQSTTRGSFDEAESPPAAEEEEDEDGATAEDEAKKEKTEKMEEDQYLKACKARIGRFAEKDVGPPWDSTGPVQERIPSQFATEVQWARRTALATAVSMVYPVLVNVQESTWAVAPALAPVLAIAISGSAALSVPCVGSVIKVCRYFIEGAAHGVVAGFIVIELVKFIFRRYIGDEYNNVSQRTRKDMVTYGLMVFATVVLTTRKTLNLVHKKLAVALIVFAVYPQPANKYKMGTFYPLGLMIPVFVAALCSLLSALLPSHISAVSLIRARAAYHGVAVRALLSTQHYCILTYEAGALAQGETLLGEIETNCDIMTRLLPLAHIEMEATPRLPGYSQTRLLRARRARLDSLVAYLNAQIKPLRGKQLALRGRAYRGPDSMPPVQVLWMNACCGPWQKVDEIACDLIDSIVALETSLDGGVPYLAKLTMTAVEEPVFEDHPQVVDDEGSDSSTEAKPSRRSTLRDAASVFSAVGVSRMELQEFQIRELHATAFNTDVLNRAQRTLDAAVRWSRHNIFFKQGKHYRKEASLSAGEHCRRMTHVYFVRNLVEILKNPPNFLKTPPLYVECVPFYLRGWPGYVKAFFCQRTTGTQFIEDVKKAMSIAVCGLLVFLPKIRGVIPHATNASITIAFIFTETVGDCWKTGGERVVGALAGTVFALIAATVYADIEKDWIVRLCSVIAVVGFTSTNAMFFSYPNVVAAFTAAGIIVEVAVVPDSTRDIQTEFLTSHAIRMNSLGALVFLVVETQFFARSSRTVVEDRVPEILFSLRDAIDEALHPFTHQRRHPASGRRRRIRSRRRHRSLDAVALTVDEEEVVNEDDEPDKDDDKQQDDAFEARMKKDFDEKVKRHDAVKDDEEVQKGAAPATTREKEISLAFATETLVNQTMGLTTAAFSVEIKFKFRDSATSFFIF